MSLLHRIAQTAYAANRVLCDALGDHRPPWASIPMVHREVIISGVAWVADHPDAMPRQAHENCIKDWAARGWRFGPVKNPETKESPALIPWEELSLQERLKNELFLIVVKAMLSKGE